MFNGPVKLILWDQKSRYLKIFIRTCKAYLFKKKKYEEHFLRSSIIELKACKCTIDKTEDTILKCIFDPS